MYFSSSLALRCRVTHGYKNMYLLSAVIIRKEIKRKTTEEVCGCIEGEDGEGSCDRGGC